MTQPINSLAQNVLKIAKEAGDKIMAIYQKDFAIYEKQDTSPLTEADLAAHNVIVEALEATSDLPILSEDLKLKEVLGHSLAAANAKHGGNDY